MKDLEKVFRALGSRKRLEIIQLLEGNTRGRSVSDLAEKIRISVKSTSKHLIHLVHVGILDRERRGGETHYALAEDPPVAFRAVRSLVHK